MRRITHDELQRYSGFSTYQVVERHFPSVLRVRPLTPPLNAWEALPHVYVGGRWFGDVTLLHEIPVSSVLEVRLLSPMEAVQRFGRESPLGAIEVVLKS